MLNPRFKVKVNKLKGLFHFLSPSLSYMQLSVLMSHSLVPIMPQQVWFPHKPQGPNMSGRVAPRQQIRGDHSDAFYKENDRFSSAGLQRQSPRGRITPKDNQQLCWSVRHFAVTTSKVRNNRARKRFWLRQVVEMFQAETVKAETSEIKFKGSTQTLLQDTFIFIFTLTLSFHL